jgi:hypothetical protein
MRGVSLSVRWLTRAVVDDPQLPDYSRPRVICRRGTRRSPDEPLRPLEVVVAVVAQGRSRFRRKSVEPSRASRRVAPGTRSGDRVDRGVRRGPGIAYCPSSQASLDIDYRGNPPQPAITRQLVATARRPIIFRPRHRLHAFQSPCSDGARGGGARTSCVPPDRVRRPRWCGR